MNVETELRNEVAKLQAALDVVAPRFANPRGGWWLRLAAFLRGLAF